MSTDIVLFDHGIFDFRVFIACLEHEITLQSNHLLNVMVNDGITSVDRKLVVRVELIHHLRQYGESPIWITECMLSWILYEDFTAKNVLIANDLRAAMISFVQEKEAKNLVMNILFSPPKDWFLPYLNYFDLSINDMFPQ